ncbi:hypothetical protein NMY22_g9401 [Coprinellus aureogranulatus]|nr:hypothetical protein NMY22_g9401 [Coprinellus aureogranulatus]
MLEFGRSAGHWNPSWYSSGLTADVFPAPRSEYPVSRLVDDALRLLGLIELMAFAAAGTGVGWDQDGIVRRLALIRFTLEGSLSLPSSFIVTSDLTTTPHFSFPIQVWGWGTIGCDIGVEVGKAGLRSAVIFQSLDTPEMNHWSANGLASEALRHVPSATIPFGVVHMISPDAQPTLTTVQEDCMPGGDTTEASSEPTPTRADFYWDHVVFQVENALFRVPRRAFEEESEVFRAMFTLPTKEGGEGGSDGSPIVLHGYFEKDFAAILKVLYPTVDDLLSNGPELTQEEWIGVLKLSSAWQMKKIREFALQRLSTEFNLAVEEKYRLGREYGVRRWLLEGLKNLCSLQPPVPVQVLQDVLGPVKACQLLAAQVEVLTSSKGRLRWPPNKNGRLSLGIAALVCTQCDGPAFSTDPSACPRCARVFPHTPHPNGLFVLNPNTYQTDICESWTPIGPTVPLDRIFCDACGNRPWKDIPQICSSCGAQNGEDRLFAINYAPRELQVEAVEEMFKDDLDACIQDD